MASRAPASSGEEVTGTALRQFAAEFAQDPEWIPSVSSTITDVIHAELPRLDEDAEMRASTFARSVTLSMAALTSLLMRISASGLTAPVTTKTLPIVRKLPLRS